MKRYIEQLDNYIKMNDIVSQSAQFDDFTRKLCRQMEQDGVGFAAVAPILALMESYPLVYFGSPGALTHFMERFFGQGYEELVKESVSKRPTVHTLWLLNRLINDATDDEVDEYLNIMRAVATNGEINADIRAEAEDFLSFYE